MFKKHTVLVCNPHIDCLLEVAPPPMEIIAIVFAILTILFFLSLTNNFIGEASFRSGR